ncbi:DNA ligase 4 [Contarinia nasturtii]|uniref:DNA ligase 4 n=1 Tax=Contarinia nasturtii TaxID=265458 RepID=UPI0012D47AD7|nr:DNA ligase 4 [Contarinia nasturtii]
MSANLPNELSALVKFEVLVTRLEVISRHSLKKHAKKERLTRFFEEIARLQRKFVAERGTKEEASSYPFLRLLLPGYDDKERKAYGMQKAALGDYYVKNLGLNRNSETARQLLIPGTEDYSEVVYNAIKSRAPQEGNLTVYEVNNYLDLIAEHYQANERNKIHDVFYQLISKMTAIQQKWLVRMILKKVSCGLSEREILSIYDERAWDLHNKRSLLSDVCAIIDSDTPLDQIDVIEVFKPIHPMLCERGYVAQIKEMLKEHKYYMDTKMDGERCHLHINGNECQYFSRRCKEIKFGTKNQTPAKYAYIFRECLSRDVKNAIFDGEMMVYNRVTNTFVKKAENSAAKYLQPNDDQFNICYVIYDLLYINGKCLIDLPYAERIRKIRTIVKVKKGAVMLCEYEKIRDFEHFLRLFNKSFDTNEEGIVLKQEESKYKPGHREKGGWFKFKPDYEKGLITDFDLLIIGGYYNDSKTSVDTYLLAVMKKGINESNKSAVFHSVCKIRNGLSFTDFETINDHIRLKKHEIRKNRQKAMTESPPGLVFASANPDFWVEPEHSVVLQIKASELTKTTTYATNYSFRFPRVIQIRWDKSPYDTCTLNEFNTFCSSGANVVKLTKRHATADDVTGETLPKRAKRINPAPKPSLELISTETKVVDLICNGLEFVILNTDKTENAISVDDMKKMVERHGGKVVDHPNSSTYVTIIGNEKTAKAKPLIKLKRYNIAKPKWLVRALGSDQPLIKLIDFTPDDMVYATEALQRKFEEMEEDDEMETAPLVDGHLSKSFDQVALNNEADPNSVSPLKGLKVFNNNNSVEQNHQKMILEHQAEEEHIDDIYTAVTQVLEPMETEEQQHHDDIFLMDTQPMQPELVNPPNEIENNGHRSVLENAPPVPEETTNYDELFPANSETNKSETTNYDDLFPVNSETNESKLANAPNEIENNGHRSILENAPPVPDETTIVVSSDDYDDLYPVNSETNESNVNLAHPTNSNPEVQLNENVPDNVKQNETQCQDDMSIFGSCIAYFYEEESSLVDFVATFAEGILIAGDGIHLQTIEDVQQSEAPLTHIFVSSAEFDRKKFKETVRSFGTQTLKNVKVMRYQWILDCEEQKKKICDTNYIVSV